MVGSSLSRAHQSSVQVEIHVVDQTWRSTREGARTTCLVISLEILIYSITVNPYRLYGFNYPRSVVHFENPSIFYISTYPKTPSRTHRDWRRVYATMEFE